MIVTALLILVSWVSAVLFAALVVGSIAAVAAWLLYKS